MLLRVQTPQRMLRLQVDAQGTIAGVRAAIKAELGELVSAGFKISLQRNVCRIVVDSPYNTNKCTLSKSPPLIFYIFDRSTYPPSLPPFPHLYE